MESRRNFIKDSLAASIGLGLYPYSLTDSFKEVLSNSYAVDFNEYDPTSGSYKMFDTLSNVNIIYAFKLVLNSNLVDRNKDLIVYCYDLTIDGELILPNRNVFIFCRNFNTINYGKINVDGLNGSQDAGKAPKRSNLGDNGEDGDNKWGLFSSSSMDYYIHGFNAGNIYIYADTITGEISLSAKGGSGRRGEAGGDGAPGAKGERGLDGNRNGQPCNGGTPGQQGKKGGNAGRGAKGGNAGNGGLIAVSTINLKDLLINYNVEAGSPGLGGSPGSPGEGGEGGDGGEKYYFEPKDHPPRGRNEDDGLASDLIEQEEVDLNFGCVRDGNHRQGPKGPSGDKNSNGENGNKGSKGNYAANEATKIQIGQVLSITLTKFLLLKGEFFYVNDDRKNAYQIFRWLYDLLGDQVGINVDSRIYKFSGRPSIVEWNLIKQKLVNYCHQIEIGLDFWGNVNNYVTLIDKDYLTRIIGPLLPLSVEFEKSFQQFHANIKNSKLALSNLNDTISIIQIKKEKLDANKEALTEYLSNILEPEVSRLSLKIQYQQSELKNMQNDFTKRLEAETNACSWVDIVKFTGMLITIGSGVELLVSGFISMKNAWRIQTKSNFSNNPTLFGNAGLIEGIKAATPGANSMIEGVKKIYNEIKSQNEQEVESTLISMEYSDFEKNIENYLQYDEARILRETMRSYLKDIDILNKKRIEITNTVIEIINTQSDIKLLESEIDRVMAKKVDLLNNSASSELIQMLNTVYFSLKLDIIKLLYLQSKSLSYWSLNAAKPRFIDKDINSLQATYINLITNDLLLEMDKRGNPSTPINLLKDIIISEKDFPNEFKLFKKGENGVHILQFHIPINAKKHTTNTALIGDWSEILLTSLRLAIPGVKTSDNLLSFTLEHMGNAHFLRRDNREKVITFQHNPVQTGSSFNYTNNDGYSDTLKLGRISMDGISFNRVNVGQSEYAYLSPFATWKLKIYSQNNNHLQLKKVKEIKINFSILMTPFKS